MGRLIIVSNRVSPPGDLGAGSVGGLAMALSAALREYSGVWFGWSGATTDVYTGQLSVNRAHGVTVATIDLDEQDRDEYYNGYANNTLWPLFHYRPDLTVYERSFDAGYQRVNRRFAEALLPLIEPDDVIWVQDYHLVLLAQELRRLGVQNRIGFFLHIPWPARRIFNTLPRHRKLVRAMLDFDLIGFQTVDHCEAFTDYIVRSAGGACEGETVRAFGQSARVGAFPIGIDFAEFQAASRSSTAADLCARMKASAAGRAMILGVDRLDYSKGLEERFLGYEQLLADHPELLEKLFFLQIATLSRDGVDAYRHLRERLDSVSGSINGTYATVEWVPIRYVNRGYRRDELAGIYRAAEIGLVTPLRDGMNLVAKEYVAAQDPDNPGVLVLSEFAGAAEQMDAAVIVNPMSREDLAEAIRRGLEMPLDERKARWQSLMEGVRTNDVTAWRDRYVTALRAVPRGLQAVATEAA
jgi:trehalose 6-phosphate synthase